MSDKKQSNRSEKELTNNRGRESTEVGDAKMQTFAAQALQMSFYR